jgi:hypothetical protein
MPRHRASNTLISTASQPYFPDTRGHIAPGHVTPLGALGVRREIWHHEID